MIWLPRPAYLFLAMSSFFLGCMEQQATMNPNLTFKFYLVVATESETTVTMKVQSTGESLILQTPAIATQSDFTAFRFAKDPDIGGALDISLNPSAARRMSKATATRGSRVAFVVDDQVFSAPMVRSSITDQLKLTGEFTKEQLDLWFQSGQK